MFRSGLLLLASALSCCAQFDINYARPNPAHDRQWFLGDWNGLRSDLAEKGVDFDFESVTDAVGVVHGGISDQPTGFTRIRGTVDIDIDQLSGKNLGLSFHATALWQTGDNIGDKLGSYANPSSLDSVHVFRMDSFWLQKQFAEGIVTVRVGQMAGWDFFGNQQYGGDYLIEPLGYTLGNIFSDTYLTFNPGGVPAAYVRLDSFRNSEQPRQGVYVKSGIFSGNRHPYQQDPTGLHFKVANSAVVASEVGYLWNAPTSSNQTLPSDRKLYPGIYRFGGVVNPDGLFTNQLTGARTRGGYLYYFMASQPFTAPRLEAIAVSILPLPTTTVPTTSINKIR